MTLEETERIQFFKKGLKRLMKAQTEQRRRELDTWQEFIKKAIEVKAKAAL